MRLLNTPSLPRIQRQSLSPARRVHSKSINTSVKPDLITTHTVEGDPPKRPPTVFTRFVTNRFGVQNPTIFKQAGVLWRALDKTTKQAHVDASRVELADYKNRVEAYRNEQGIERPRRPVIPWVMYALEMRQGLRAGSKAWKALNQEQQQPYVDAWKAARERYRIRKLEYKLAIKEGVLLKEAAAAEYTRDKARVVMKKAKIIQLARQSQQLSEQDKPPPRPVYPYILFRWANPGTPPKALRETWNSLSDASKKPYEDAYDASISQWQADKKIYYERVDPKILDILNADYVLRGANRRHRKARPIVQNKRPMMPFVRFYKAISISSLVDAGKRWRAMSDEEKAPYKDAAAKEWVKWRARRGDPSSSSAE